MKIDLKKLKIPTLKYRRARGDIIEVFKIVHGHYDNINRISLLPHVDVATMVVDSDSINCFKSRLDKFWTNQDVLHNGEADFTGTGN